ncbi:hypothetical protein BDV29DRAFT_173888 [Aspergillus leporis]|uniref:Uncharacterized protein n=1 Tax=Aspergillus leporis TaxID=41062 RepID=A0A5N5X0M1_9EURO|nr:hypothetical protein BDV29DRAFT_173888 [Aspergillus leporis]
MFFDRAFTCFRRYTPTSPFSALIMSILNLFFIRRSKLYCCSDPTSRYYAAPILTRSKEHLG